MDLTNASALVTGELADSAALRLVALRKRALGS